MLDKHIARRWPCHPAYHADGRPFAAAFFRDAFQNLMNSFPCAVRRCGLHGLYIEMKYGDNRPTPDQKLFLKESNELG